MERLSSPVLVPGSGSGPAPENNLTAQLRRTIWTGSIPCLIHLDPISCRTFEDSPPYYTQLPRTSYLPLHTGPVRRFFLSYLIDPDASLPHTTWFDFDGVPLKWHWPIGLLYDLLTGRDPSSPTEQEQQQEQQQQYDDGEGLVSPSLPWNLTVHFAGFPDEYLLRLPKEATLEEGVGERFMNSLKEADYVRNGNSRAVMSLSKGDSEKLWRGMVEHDFEKFWSVNEKLISSAVSPIRNIPMKLYLPSSAKVIQKLIPPQASRETTTLGAALKTLAPDLFVSKTAPLIAKPVMHGIVLPMNTPLLELMRELAYPDGFLHVAIAMMC